MGVREANRFLFQRLEEILTADERAVFFNDYMSVKFQLHQWEEQSSDKARKSIKNSYLRFLRGWGMESNSIEGAVLKGWVESRIGLPPTFHKVKITMSIPKSISFSPLTGPREVRVPMPSIPARPAL